MGEIWEGQLGPQDPMFGIDHAKIVDRITRDNWRSKAVVRVHAAGPLYLFVARMTRAENVRYQVEAEGPEATQFSRSFESLEKALSYANGEDGGLLTTSTRSADSTAEYPPGRGTPVFVGPVFRPKAGRPDEPKKDTPEPTAAQKEVANMTDEQCADWIAERLARSASNQDPEGE